MKQVDNVLINRLLVIYCTRDQDGRFSGNRKGNREVTGCL